ncbi:PREDICTED: 28S ribosomal protein S18c, mitochondrial [Polistes canadensis]|uniref:28S ribosomal protein S18c, mitochondrial n=1 Tax=Polistes canadensis TaxID=91411 RepID=UPI000718C137|nr:PREDICTED: 28S ribosomal protein S18c, mitochondrial [Polistes canadensis]XP_014602591.1 PREDICTED: 28S ribosomal protein S18c, mitochondrial [Polistes canadensis]XP_014602592.1 PREDICTED: 28S ribosomal protein S18c, mitochondrial [Polistes canadensis]XP_014602593.1 PREDICTED: 28S ribosomal protein S18c, mitochondrial [Polistes canadensis]
MIRNSGLRKVVENFVKKRRQYSNRFVGSLSNHELQNKKLSEEEDMVKDMPNLTINPYKKEKQQCLLCKLNIEPNFKNVRLLSQFQSRYTGRIYGKHITGLCKNKQEKVEREILKAQNAGLMGYFTKDPRYVNDPPLFNPDRPLRPHKY